MLLVLALARSSPTLHCPRHSASCMSSLAELEAAAFAALEKEERLDAKLGAGTGAAKERAAIRATLDEYEEVLEASAALAAAEEAAADPLPEQGEDRRQLYHEATDHIAVFGGDPNRRKVQVSKQMQPYASLALYGTPRDVGLGDQQRLVSQIRRGKLDVVYCWTRFSNHGSRYAIRQACVATPGVQFVEVASLSVMDNSWSGGRSECDESE